MKVAFHMLMFGILPRLKANVSTTSTYHRPYLMTEIQTPQSKGCSQVMHRVRINNVNDL